MNAMLANMMKAFGFEIDPEEVIAMVQQMAADVAAMRASQLRTERMVRELWIGEQQHDRSRHPNVIPGPGAARHRGSEPGTEDQRAGSGGDGD
jgi:hypothetical protein